MLCHIPTDFILEANTVSGASLLKTLHPGGLKFASLVTCPVAAMLSAVEITPPRGSDSAAAGSSL